MSTRLGIIDATMSWASRRRSIYITIISLIILSVVATIGMVVFYESPTCFDGRHNGNEEGVDCGGECTLICSLSAAEIEVLYSRSLPLADGVYSVVAVLENPNARAIARNVPYSVKMRDSEGLLVAEYNDVIDIPAQREIPLFIHRIDTGLRTPTRTDVTITDTPTWERVSEAPNEPTIRLTGLNTNRVIANLANPFFDPIEDITAVAIVSGADGNVIATSQTVVDYIAPNGTVEVVFTWPDVFDVPAASADVLIRTSL